MSYIKSDTSASSDEVLILNIVPIQGECWMLMYIDSVTDCVVYTIRYKGRYHTSK